MSWYSSIDRRINADAWFRGLSEGAQLLWLKLLIGRHVTPVAGLWSATEAGLAESFGMPLERFRERFLELTREPATNGLPRVVADWSAGVIWLPNSIEQDCNQPKNPNALKGWIEHLEMVPECSLKNQALSAFAQWVKRYPERFKQGLPKGFPKPKPLSITNGLANKEQEQEQDQEQEIIPQTPTPEPDPAPVTDCPLPSSPEGWIRIPVNDRARLLETNKHAADWACPHLWPELTELAEAMHGAGGASPRLLSYQQDPKVRQVVGLLAAGYGPAELVSVATQLPREKFWRERKLKGERPPSLLNLTSETVCRHVETSKPAVDDPEVQRLLRAAGVAQ